MSTSAGTRRLNETGLAPQYPPVGTSPRTGGPQREDFKLSQV
jgi:hypothetical protein